MPSARNSFRVKLEFEVPPPGLPTSRKYVILVNTDVCKTIYDLEHTIIRRFGFSKGSTITLALDGFVLVSQEDINVLSNDDCISVNIHQDISKAELSSVKKKRKASAENGDVALAAKKVKSIKRKGTNNASNKPENGKVKKEPRAVKKRKVSTSEDSSETSSTEEERPQKRSNCVIKGNYEPSATNPGIKNLANASLTHNKFNASTTTSSTGLMKKDPAPCKESEAVPAVSKPVTASQNKPQHHKKARLATLNQPNIDPTGVRSANHITFNSSSSELSGSECEMETKVPIHSDVKTATPSLKTWLSSGNNKSNHSPKQYNGFKDPGVSTNISVVYETPPVSNDAEDTNNETEKKLEQPTRDYSELLPSTWPPRVGDIVAYKILEMSEDYTPVISDYKEVKILEIFPSSASPLGVDAVKMQYLWPQKHNTKREGGRFEMDFSDDEPSDNEDFILEWQSVLEPKRID